MVRGLCSDHLGAQEPAAPPAVSRYGVGRFLIGALGDRFV
jgi:hypothetical protein